MTNRGTSKKVRATRYPCCKQYTRCPKVQTTIQRSLEDGRALAEKYNAISKEYARSVFFLVQQKAKLKRDQDQQVRQVQRLDRRGNQLFRNGCRKKWAGQPRGSSCSPIDRMLSVFSFLMVLSRLFLWVVPL